MSQPFLVLSHRHEMIPVAHRLRLEGEDVELVVWPAGKSYRFEKAWEGAFPQIIRGSQGDITDSVIDGIVEEASSGKFIVVTNSWSAGNRFSGSQNLYAASRRRGVHPPTSVVRLGAWFDGERFYAPHGLIVDRGAWPGGMGQNVPGAMTLARFDTPDAIALFEGLTEPEADGLKSDGFRGLIQWGLHLDSADGIPRLDGEIRGWPWLHTHAFLSALEGLGDVLRGAEVDLPKKYVVVAPVTIPPWPAVTSGGCRKVEVSGLTPKYQGRCFWHDVKIDQESQTISTAGLDGMVAVVRGEGGTVEWARAQALELAMSIDLPEKQFRPDMAAGVAKALGGLEGAFGLVV